jgi:fructokinase
VIVVAGEALIDLILAPDGRLEAVAGGGPFNTARTIARLGGDVAFLGRLSTDRFGARLRAALDSDGVDLRWAPATDDPTTLAVAEVDEHGSATYRFHLAETSAPGLAAVTVADALATRPDAVHVGTLGLAVEPIASVLATAAATLPDATLLMVDVNVRPNVIRDRAAYLARLEPIVSRADVIKVSADDLAYLAPSDDPRRAAHDLQTTSGSVVLVTDGPRAVEVLGAGWQRRLPVPATLVVDTVGAGDAFGGGFLARWINRGSGRGALRDAAAVADAAMVGIEVAAITCGRAGADPPHRAEVPSLAANG